RSRSDMNFIAQRLSSEGFAVMNIDYRLAPKFKFPAQLDDLEMAHEYLLNNSERLNVDLTKLYGWGFSSIGHLISHLALKRKAYPFRAVVAGATPFDLARYPKSPYLVKLVGKYRDD